MENVSIYIRENNHLNAQETICRQEEKVAEYCKSKKYLVCDSAVIIGNREESFPALLDLLEGAKEKEITKILMTSTNRVVGEIEDIKRVSFSYENSRFSPLFLSNVESDEEKQ